MTQFVSVSHWGLFVREGDTLRPATYAEMAE